jgi:hypothetical protein
MKNGTYEQAAHYLGRDFIPPELLMQHPDGDFATHFQYSAEQIFKFASTVPSVYQLLLAQKGGYMLVAGPIIDTNLIGVRELDRSLFYEEIGWKCWWREDRQTFSQNEMCKGSQWIMIKKGALQNSRSKGWNEQLRLVQSPEFVPNSAEVSYAVSMYRKVHRVNILPNLYVRTSSVCLLGNHIYIGSQCSDSLRVSHDWNNKSKDNLGVTSAFKFTDM